MIINFIKPALEVIKTTDKIALNITTDTASLVELFKIGCGTIQVAPEFNFLDKKYYYIMPPWVNIALEGDYNAEELQYIISNKQVSLEEVQWLSAIFMTVHFYENLLSAGVDPLKCNNILTENKRVDIIYTATKEQWVNIFGYNKNELVNMKLKECSGTFLLESAERQMKFQGMLK